MSLDKKELLEKAKEYWKRLPFLDKTIEPEPNISSENLKNLIEILIEYRAKEERSTIMREKVVKLIQKENLKTMLDFGCGLSPEGVYLAQKTGIEIVLADITSLVVDFTSRYSEIFKIKSKSILVEDGAVHDFGQVFDMIAAQGVLHHIYNAKEVLNNLTRYLRKDGYFLVMLYLPGKNTNEGPYTRTYTKEEAIELFGEKYQLIDYWIIEKHLFGWYIFKKMV